MRTIKTRLQRLETAQMSEIDLTRRAWREIPPTPEKRALVWQFLNDKECSIASVDAFTEWFATHQDSINKLFDRIKPNWREEEEAGKPALVAELSELVTSGQVSLEEISTLFPDLMPQVRLQVAMVQA